MVTAMVATSGQFDAPRTSAKYDLDGLGNWRRFITDPVGGSLTTQVRQHNGLNEITRVDSTPFEYDGVPGASNGNLANDGTLAYEWDALNRLVKVYKTPDSPVIIGTYTYDALNRRICKVVENGGLPGESALNGTTDCLYQGWQCVEERDGSNNPTKQYVWGIYLDELLQIYMVEEEAYYPLQDLLYRTTALTDESGAIVEAYDYDAYGNTLIFDAAGTRGNWWANDATQTDVAFCQFLFTGQRLDAETVNYCYKRRYYSPKWGRFFSKDPIEFNFNNLKFYHYVLSNPLVYTDSSGLEKEKPNLPDIPIIDPGKDFPRWQDAPEVPPDADPPVPGKDQQGALEIAANGGVDCAKWGKGAKWQYRTKAGCVKWGWWGICPWPSSGTCTIVFQCECAGFIAQRFKIGNLVWKCLPSECKDACV